MNADTGEMREFQMGNFKDAFGQPDLKKQEEEFLKKLGALKAEGFTVPFRVGDEVEIKGCRFRIEYIRSGKEPIMTVVGLPKFVSTVMQPPQNPSDK